MQLEPNVLSIIIPTPGKKMSGQKCRKKQETRHDTSDVYFKQTLAKRKLKVEKEGNAKSIPKKKQHQASNIKGVFPDLHEESDENTPCGCCGLKLRAEGWLDQVPSMLNVVSLSLCCIPWQSLAA